MYSSPLQTVDSFQTQELDLLLPNAEIQEQKDYVRYEDLEDLAASAFAQDIEILNVGIPNNLKYLDNLCLVSPIYFNNIKCVNILFIENEEKSVKEKEIRIDQPLIIQGFNITSKIHKCSLKITGQFDVSISNSKFNRVMLQTHNNKNVMIKNSSFVNSSFFGLENCACNTLILNGVNCKDCMWGGIYVEACKNMVVQDFNVSVYYGSGCSLKDVLRFQIGNACIQNCSKGFHFQTSNGEIFNSVVRKCSQFGIVLKNSHVSYNQIQFVKIESQEVYSDYSVFEQG